MLRGVSVGMVAKSWAVTLTTLLSTLIVAFGGPSLDIPPETLETLVFMFLGSGAIGGGISVGKRAAARPIVTSQAKEPDHRVAAGG